MVCGAIFLGLSVARLAAGCDPSPGRLGPEFGCCAAGAALGLWGWSRLRRARAAQPALTWWQFLHAELIGVGVAVLLLPVWAALSPEQRDSLMRSLLELADLVTVLRGRL
jgi:hypothetical protein